MRHERCDSDVWRRNRGHEARRARCPRRPERQGHVFVPGARFDVMPGDRIAQALLVPVHEVELIEVDELSETVRGAGGLGSTGA